MQKTVTAGMRNTTVTLDGTECAVKFSGRYSCFEVLNESGGDVTMSVYEGKNAGDDGVMTVHSGMSATLAHMRRDISTVYIKGTGRVQVAAKNSGEAVFKTGAGGGDIDVLLPWGRYTSAAEDVVLDLDGSMEDYSCCILCIQASASNYVANGQDCQVLFDYSSDNFMMSHVIHSTNINVYLKDNDLTPSQIKIGKNNLGKYYALFGVK